MINIKGISFYSNIFRNNPDWFLFQRISQKVLYKFGLSLSVSRYSCSLSLFSASKDSEYYDNLPTQVCINIGSGGFSHPRWTCYDFQAKSKTYKKVQGTLNKDFYHIDLMDNDSHINLPDNSVSLIYCSHTLEHLGKKGILNFLKESERVLSPGGICRISLPDINQHSRLLTSLRDSNKSNEEKFDSYLKEFLYDLLARSRDIQIQILKSITLEENINPERIINRLKLMINIDDDYFDPDNPHHHVNLVDYKLIKSLCRDLSFKCCVQQNYNSSFSEIFLNKYLFDTTRPDSSIYIELLK